MATEILKSLPTYGEVNMCPARGDRPEAVHHYRQFPFLSGDCLVRTRRKVFSRTGSQAAGIDGDTVVELSKSKIDCLPYLPRYHRRAARIALNYFVLGKTWCSYRGFERPCTESCFMLMIRCSCFGDADELLCKGLCCWDDAMLGKWTWVFASSVIFNLIVL